jgi:hypothetical protein
MWGLIVSAWPAVVMLFGAITGAIGAALPIILAVAAAIAALGFALVMLAGDGEDFGQRWESGITTIIQWTKKAIAWIQTEVPKIWYTFKTAMELMAIQAEYMGAQVFNFLSVMADNAFTAIFVFANNVVKIWDWMNTNWNELWLAGGEALVAFVKFGLDLWESFSETASDYLANIWLDEANKIAIGDYFDTAFKEFERQLAVIGDSTTPFPEMDTAEYRDWVRESVRLEEERQKAIEDAIKIPDIAADVKDFTDELNRGTKKSKDDMKAIAYMARVGAAALERGTVEASKAIATGYRREDLVTLNGDMTPDEKLSMALEEDKEEQAQQTDQLKKANDSLHSQLDKQEQMIALQRDTVRAVSNPQFEVIGLA